MKSISIFLISILSLLCSTSFNDIDELDELDTIINKIEQFNTIYFENIYVQTNKENYQPGDKIWFKAYITGVANQSSSSSILYVQIQNDSSKILSTKRYQIIDGKSSGEFYLNDYLSNGEYSISCFTEKSNYGGKPFLKKIHVSDIQSLSQLDYHESSDVYTTSQNTDLLSIYEEDDSINMVLKKLPDEIHPVNVILTVNGEIFWASEEDASRQIKIALPIHDLPVGAATISVIDFKGDLLCKNSILVNKDQMSEINIVLDKNEYLPEDSITINLGIKDYKGLPIQGDFSVSVFLKELNFNPNRTSFFDQMNQADYIPANILNNMPSTNSKDKYVIKGKIENRKKRIGGIQVIAMDTQGEVIYEAVTAEDGSFSIDVDSADYPLTFLVNSSDQNQKMLSIILDDQTFPTLESRAITNNHHYVDLAPKEEISEIKKENSFAIKDYLDYQILKEIVVKDQRIEEIMITDQRIDGSSVNEVKLFTYFDNVKVDSRKGEDLIKSGGLGGTDPNDGFISLLRQVTQINYVQNGQVYLRGWKAVNPSPPLLVLNGMPLGYDITRLNNVHPSTIKEIKVIRNLGAVSQFGDRAQGGVVLVTTNNVVPDFIETTPAWDSTPKVTLSNFYEQTFEKFYPTQPDNKKIESCAYWNANVIVNESGKFSFQYKNLPFKGTMIIKIEGIDENKNFMSYETSYTIN